MNLISFDYGKKYIGIALGNLFYNSYFPLIIIKNSFYFYKIIKNIFIKFSPKIILFGFSLYFKDLKSYINLIFSLKKMIIKINNLFNKKIFLINEDYSSYFSFKKYDHFCALNFIKYFLNFRR